MLLPVSAEFAAAVKASHTVLCGADLWYDGNLLASNLPVVEGQLSIDDDALTQARLSLTIADPYNQYTPRLPSDVNAINVYGQEVFLKLGVLIPGRGPEYVGAGWFRVQQLRVKRRWRRPSGRAAAGGATLTADALDRIQAITDYRFLAPEQPAPGATCFGEIRRLAQGVVPLAEWPPLDDPAVPSTLTYTESRRDALAALAAAADVRVFMNNAGNLDIRPLILLGGPAPLTPDWTLSAGPDGGLFDLEETLSRDGVYNAIVARGEQTGDHAPVQGIAYETRPTSPTRWDGPYGRVPAFMASPLLDSQQAADKAATTRLGTLLAARDRQVTVYGPPNPAVLPGLTIIRAVTPHVTYTGLCSAMTLPCGPRKAAYVLRVPESEIVPTAPGDE
jgi:hypothetical protein